MFLPPVDPGTPWTNDFDGDAQTPHPWLGNVTFELIDQVGSIKPRVPAGLVNLAGLTVPPRPPQGPAAYDSS